MRLLKHLILLCILASSLTVWPAAAQTQQSPAKMEQNPCVNKNSCRECIQTLNCGWCMKPDYGDRPRCFLHTPKPEVCAEEFIWNPDTSETIVINKNLTLASSSAAWMSGQGISGGSYESSSSGKSSASGSYSASGSSASYGSSSSSGSSYGAQSASDSSSAYGAAGAYREIVQIKPQRVSLKLRVNEVHSLDVSYAQAEDYPVDLYYLMDLSKSMEDDKLKLNALGDQLVEAMKQITTNFRLGFGTFVGNTFHNHMPLSINTGNFATRQHDVIRSAAASNLTASEGGLYAIFQAVACGQQIGWRAETRRLLVFASSSGLNLTGVGQLGDELSVDECQFDAASNMRLNTQRKPSVSHLNEKVRQNAISIIFAVAQHHFLDYLKLSYDVRGLSAGILANDSSNVVELVRNKYNKISTSVEMKDNSSAGIEIEYYSNCLFSRHMLKTNQCRGLKIGDSVTFSAQIKLTKCPTDPRDWKQTIQIYPVGINESMIIDLEMLCSCQCEQPGSRGYEFKSQHCSAHGTYMCGICECDDQHLGSYCECSTSGDDNINDNVCRMGNNTDVPECNGRGNCLCGACECNKRAHPEEVISGKYCECDNFSCERHKGLLCSGSDHGVCECNRCVCKPGWTGSSCDCQLSNESCMAPNSTKICSDHGTCECGACKCQTTENGRYSGKYCDKCPTCSGRCQELKNCVQCQMYNTGELKNGDDCAKNCTTFTPIGVEKVKIDEDKDEQLCVFFDEDDCKFTFKYNEDNTLHVYAQNERKCPHRFFGF